MTTARSLVLLGCVEAVLLAALGWFPGADRFPLPGLALFAAAFAAYAVAAWSAGRSTDGARPGLVWIWAAGALMRLTLVPLAPELSDDAWRYLWDGHVQLSGINPYLHAPAAAALEPLRTAWHAAINNPDVPTIYPPFAQFAFVLIGLVGSSVFTAKVLWLACDAATAVVLVRVAQETGRNEARVLVLYWWAPLLVIEVAWSAHLEPLGLLVLSLAVLWAHRAGQGDEPAAPDHSTRGSAHGWKVPPSVAAGTTLALAALTKFAPAAALPALVRRHGPLAALAFGGTVVALYLPYASAGGALFTGLRTYGEHWWFMKGPFTLLEAVAGDPVIARRLAALVVIGVVGWTAFARFDLERALLWTIGAGIIITPTLHPWYVLWMLPMAALRSARPWIGLCGLAFLGYYGLDAFHATGVWPQPPLLRVALWLPFLGLLFHDALRRDPV